MTIEPGQRIGNYHIETHLGSGAFATVWFARDVMLDAPVAVKVLADNWSRDPEIHHRFIEEAKLLRRIDDDHVVRVFTVDDLPDGRPFFVMAFADRGTLHDRIDARPPAEPWRIAEAVDTAVELLACLDVVHDLGVVHRDLKPSNVLYRSLPEHVSRRIGRTEAMVLADFGLAKDLVRASGFTMAAGTPAYMAPEQTRSTTQLDHRADLFSATAILYELLVGRPPVDAETLSGRRRTRWSVADLGFEMLAGLLPQPLIDVLQRGLADEPIDRFGSAGEMIGALSPFAESASPAARTSAPAVPGARTRRRSGGPVDAELRRRVATLADRLPAAAGEQLRAVLSRPFAVAVVADDSDRSAATTRAAFADRLQPVPAGPGAPPISVTTDHLGSDAVAHADAVVATLDPPAAAAADRLDALIGHLGAVPAGPVLLVGVVDVDGPLPPAVLDEPRIVSRVARLVTVADPTAAVAALSRVGQRVDAVRASAALAAMLGRPSSASHGAPGGGDVMTPAVLDEIDDLRSKHPLFAEMQVVRDEVSGRLLLPAQLRVALRDALLLGAFDPPSMTADGAADDGRRQAIEAELSRWRSYQNSGRASFAARSAVETVITGLERRWAAS